MTRQTFKFEPCVLPQSLGELRRQVREFLATELASRDPRTRVRSWEHFDADFSRAFAARGWIGMTWPKRYGGGERSALERYVVIEELLAGGAPVAAHWIADRQSGPLLLRFGTEAQRERYLPRIVRGECFFCIGMSEPDAGSDLANLRTRAVKVDGGWRVNGTKVWTSFAHVCHMMILLCRTREKSDERHAGMSQLLVDLKTPGVTVRPIINMMGGHNFNEVTFTDAFIPDDCLVGEEGNGWHQVTSELAFERSGPERLLSTYVVLSEMVGRLGPAATDAQAAAIGRLVAHLSTLRQMSVAVAQKLDAGLMPNLEASIVKELGNVFEQVLPEVAREIVEVDLDIDSPDVFDASLAYGVTHAPSFSLRGGTREILRGIIARGLGLR
ncbi:MAG: acyl-CoA dehydrogenase family protein [Gammaproteobacteria bacterium]